MIALWPVVRRSLSARRLRAVLTVSAIALGMGVVLGVRVTEDALAAQAVSAANERQGTSSFDVRSLSGNGFDAASIARAAAVPGVADSAPFLEKRVTAQSSPNDVNGTTVTVVAVRNGSVALRAVQLLSGRLPVSDSLDEITVDQQLLSALSPSHPLALGAMVRLMTVRGPDTYRIVGVSAGTTAGVAFTRSAIFISERAMTSAFALGVHSPMIAVRVAPTADATAVEHAVRVASGPAASVVDPTTAAAVPLRELQPLLMLVTVLSLLVALGVTANNMGLTAFERRRETALLRTAGASSRQVFRIFVSEAAVMTAAAIPVGLALGLALSWGSIAVLAATLLVHPSLPFDAAALTESVALGIAVGLLGAALPALNASRLSVLEGLRPPGGAAPEAPSRIVLMVAPIALCTAAAAMSTGDPLATAAGAGLVVVGVAAALPIVGPALISLLGRALSPLGPELQVAAGNLSRRRNRTALTLAGVTAALASAVAVSAVSAGSLQAGDAWVTSLFPGDAIVTSPVAERDDVAVSLAQTHGIRSATAVRLFVAAIGGRPTGFAAIDPAAFDSGGALTFPAGDRTRALAALGSEPGVVIPSTVAAATQWRSGTSVPVTTTQGVVPMTVVGVADHTYPAGDGSEAILVGRATALRYFGQTAAGFDDLVLTTSGDLRPVIDRAASFGLRVVRVSTIQNASREALQHAIGMLMAIAALTVIMAMVAVLTTLLVNVRQGVRELAILRAIGLSRRRAVSLLVCEATLLATCGTIVGVVTGIAVTVPALRATATPGFAPGFTIPAPAALGCGIALVLGAAAASLVPSRRAASASIVTSIRQE